MSEEYSFSFPEKFTLTVGRELDSDGKATVCMEGVTDRGFTARIESIMSRAEVFTLIDHLYAHDREGAMHLKSVVLIQWDIRPL